MTQIDLRGVCDKILAVIEAHKVTDGQYARWLWQDARSSRELGVNPYGCADAANTLYMLGEFPRDPAERAEWVRTLRAMQDPETGLYHESTHHAIHTTAHCMAALELFDAMPEHRAAALERCMEPGAMAEFLDSLGWVDNPWPQSHQGAGLYVALNLGGSETEEFNRAYFDWLWENADPETGMWRRECTLTGVKPLWHHMAGSFHYLFNHEHAHMPLRYPEKMIDSCLAMYENGDIPNFGKRANFIEIDWIFCLTRASRQTPHRFWEIRDALVKFAHEYAEFWLNADYERDESLNDLHMLFGGVCALAELQQTLRGLIVTKKPLKLVLDRRPFI
ncbi:MAG: hypothetical protein IJ493_13805 [Clostridia bacterium]|nr:hypothetical protein [Clostridia bacterium]